MSKKHPIISFETIKIVNHRNHLEDEIDHLNRKL